MFSRLLACGPCAAVLLLAGTTVAEQAAVVVAESQSTLRFESDIRPLLKAHCWHCHGEEAEVEGSLDLRLSHFMQTGGDSGPAVIPGDADGSLLVERIASGEMPPGDVKMSAEELGRIVRWIDQGAETARPEPETMAVGDIFTEQDREHWSFRPLRRPAVPRTPPESLARTAVDAFLWKRLDDQGLGFSPAADRETLIRRLTFNLTGLPPTPAAVAEFVADPRADAYERLVDSLLDSPAYGERWGRHWLDVAGYADSDGYAAKDIERKWAWKYRDYVINAFNDDKSWREFIIEQLAGDELVSLPYEDISEEDSARLIATGFLRMGPDGTGDGSADQKVARNDVIAETIKIVSTSLLGLTVGCAQCHSHRYDPISHVDYHRLRAVFEPAYDWQDWRSSAARLVSQWSDDTRQQAAEIDRQLKELAAARTAELDQLVDDTFERELAKLPEEIRAEAREARQTAVKERTDRHHDLIKEYPFLNVSRGSVYLYLPDRLRGFNQKWDQRQAELQDQRPADDLIRCLTEVPGKVPETKLFHRGDINQPRQVVAPGELAVINPDNRELPVDDPELPTSGRRLAYARHLTDGEHPLVARALVNRFWMHHFGRGIVATPSDFGMLGEPPSHPELLDWLASEFVAQGWSLKRFHRLILNSHAYRQVSTRRDELDAVDPENRLLGRMSIRRLEAEVVRDSLLAVSGQLANKVGGQPVPVAPDEVGQIVVAADTRDSAGRPTKTQVALGEDEFRRSLYVQVRRSMPLGVLEPFDMPSLAPNCELRTSSTVAPQSLMLLNSPFVVEQTRLMAERVIREAGEEPAARFASAWKLAFGREPAAAELAAGIDYLVDQTERLRTSAAESDAKAELPPDTAALATLCQALLSSNGFLYLD